jgi:AraC family transcriptional regulator
VANVPRSFLRAQRKRERRPFEVQLSRYQFTRIFQKVTGYTPHEYLLRVRLSRARALIREKGHAMSLAEIAVTCGFFDQAHLGRHFRRFFGTTPAAFLREQKRTRR